MSEYLHDRGTDKLIAAVQSFDPTKVNPGEADEVTLAILGQGDAAVAVVGNADGSIETRAVRSAYEPQYVLGVCAGVHTVLAKMYGNRDMPIEEIERIRAAVRADLIAEYGRDIGPSVASQLSK